MLKLNLIFISDRKTVFETPFQIPMTKGKLDEIDDDGEDPSIEVSGFNKFQIIEFSRGKNIN